MRDTSKEARLTVVNSMSTRPVYSRNRAGVERGEVNLRSLRAVPKLISHFRTDRLDVVCIEIEGTSHGCHAALSLRHYHAHVWVRSALCPKVNI